MLYLFLGLYLYGLQLVYESPRTLPVAKALLFPMLIFGGGLSYDILKHIIKLPDARLRVFLLEFGKTLAFMLAYAALFVLFFLLLGPWAGWQTTFVLIVGFLSVAAGVKALSSFSSAMDAAIKHK